MRTLSDLQKKILKEEYPNLNYDSDPDVERYFELRNDGRQGEALGLYNGKLKRKYPDDGKRALLLRTYRSRDPAYRYLYQESLVDLADRLLSRTNKIIEILTKDIDSVNMADAYSVIKLAEGLLAVISPDRYEAIAFTERYTRYAKALAYRPAQMQKTAELIRLYVTDTLESVQELKKNHEQKRRERVKNQQAERRQQQPAFDLTSIQFTLQDLARIQIPSAITRTEDIVIAFCLRYWNLVFDAAFEKTVFLYSRKYHSNHHEVYQAIKNGRTHGWKDEEILNAVLATVVTGYYYSIAGDVYLQRTWKRYSAGLAPQTAPQSIAVTAPEAAPIARKSKKQNRAGDKAVKVAKTAGSARARGNAAIKARPVKPVTPFKPERAQARRGKPQIPQAPAFKPNSVADIIKKLTGKTYTVYKELFFKTVRASIRVTLSSSSTKRGDLFGNRQNEAEETIYGFLFEHFSDPYQNWKDSEAHKDVEALGYNVPSIEPIIVDWVKKTNARENSAIA
ncbi:MAG TPA: hypothetical protein PKO22_01050 [Treponemataceae bacterium]|nr:hypothetical protein [Treponemataceae bacterium]